MRWGEVVRSLYLIVAELLRAPVTGLTTVVKRSSRTEGKTTAVRFYKTGFSCKYIEACYLLLITPTSSYIKT